MDHIHSNTFDDVHTSGRHLPLEERDMIQALHRRGLSFRDIAAVVTRLTQRIAKTPGSLVKSTMMTASRSTNGW